MKVQVTIYRILFGSKLTKACKHRGLQAFVIFFYFPYIILILNRR